MNTLKVGVTGGIGAGKSIICKLLSTLGYPVFYSDKVAKELMSSNLQLKESIKQLLGEEAYLNGLINKAYISGKVFTNKSLLNALNELVHPAVRSEFDKRVENSSSKIYFNEAAILFETGAFKKFDYNILVTADLNTRIQRVIKRDSVTREQVLDRMKNQWDDEKKGELADFIITNNENKLLITQVLEVISSLTSPN